MQPSENSQLNQDYAQEWLTYLKRRNLILTIIWPVLLVLSILTSLTAFYYSQLEQSSKLSLLLETDKNHALEETKQILISEMQALKSSNLALNEELESLKSAREELSVLNNNSTSKLNITSQMVDNLNQLVAELKNEKADLTAQLEDSLETINQLKKQHQQYITQSNKEKTSSVTELNKQLESRKSAYQALANRQQEMRDDMDRFNNLNNSKDKQIEQLKKESQHFNLRLSEKTNEIAVYKNRISVLEKSYSELELKLNSLISPIGGTQQSKPAAKTQATQQTDASRKITGLEEIKKPVKQNNSNNESTNQDFDHNQISILP
tara:strand:+ start:2110 stop:3075 length:966 start_codon:yes stop_codon:yes gene_type:complete